jgi:polysaccharide pyruvyl transferase WcaK-like protein
MVLIGGGTFVPKEPEHPGLLELSRHIPTAFFGTGVGDPALWGTTYMPVWLEVLDNARFIGLRGPLSVERLVEWGVPRSRLEWIGDPALYFATPEHHIRSGSGRLAVNLGVTYENLDGCSEQQLEHVVTSAVTELKARGWHVTLVSAWGPDDVVVDRVAETIHADSIEYWHDDFERALEAVGSFDVVLSEKLHVAVVAACKAVPFVALSYRSKITDFCRSVDWEEFSVGLRNLESSAIVDLIDRLSARRDWYSEKLQESVAQTRARLLAAVPRAAGIASREPA